jgi:hypothetical protein
MVMLGIQPVAIQPKAGFPGSAKDTVALRDAQNSVRGAAVIQLDGNTPDATTLVLRDQ